MQTALQVLLPSVGCGFFNQSCDLFRSGDVDRMAGASDFDLVTVGSCGIPTPQLRIDGFISRRY
jgi:hypothetical protein